MDLSEFELKQDRLAGYRCYTHESGRLKLLTGRFGHAYEWGKGRYLVVITEPGRKLRTPDFQERMPWPQELEATKHTVAEILKCIAPHKRGVPK